MDKIYITLNKEEIHKALIEFVIKHNKYKPDPSRFPSLCSICHYVFLEPSEKYGRDVIEVTIEFIPGEKIEFISRENIKRNET